MSLRDRSDGAAISLIIKDCFATLAMTNLYPESEQLH